MSKTETQTRSELINIQLARSGWFGHRFSIIEEAPLSSVAEEQHPYRYETTDQKTQRLGFADYLLFGTDGKPLAVVEAKRTSRDPLAGKRQAEDYAESIIIQHGQAPFIFLTNGNEIQFWDRERYAPRKVAGFYTRDDLERLNHQKKYARPLNEIQIEPNIAGRDYQNEAIRRVTEGIDAAKRKFLLVMATGTGKTRTTIALSDVLLRAKRVQRILFLADRRALVRQAMSEFKAHLPHESLARIEGGQTSGARIQFSTYPSMIQVYQQLSVGYYDLIIADESHRSIYQRYKALFDHFDAIQLGLTATPTDYIDHNTFELFDCGDNTPSYYYSYEQAIKDKYLVNYRVLDAQTNFQIKGIQGESLPESLKQMVLDQGKDDAITNKSELLFLWLMLDLLEVGGRCAVIIPEGVLFGNTDAHVRLRRELLTEHVVEGIISLPGGVFQPYTGVKTSILVFRKETRRDDKQTFTGGTEPRTDYVWFYEVEEDGYTRDAKRNPRPGQTNDLWDAIEKFKAWSAGGRDAAKQNPKTLLQPSFHSERWRHALLRDTADKLTPAGEAFSGLADTSMWDGQVWAIHELFPKLPANPQEAETQIREAAVVALRQLADRFFTPTIKPLCQKWAKTKKSVPHDKVLKEWHKATRIPQQEFNRAAREAHKYFEASDSPSLPLWKELTKEALNNAMAFDESVDIQTLAEIPDQEPVADLTVEMATIAREVAKLDGFDITLRSLEIDQTLELKETKHWVVPVRDWQKNDEWQSEDGQLKGSHDVNGIVRPAYVEAMLTEGLYDDKGKLKNDLLNPDCIEARDWNLSAGQYKPFDFTQLKSEKSVVELIAELKKTEHQIISGLDTLLAMVKGRA